MSQCAVPGCAGQGSASATCSECGRTLCPRHRPSSRHRCREQREGGEISPAQRRVLVPDGGSRPRVGWGTWVYRIAILAVAGFLITILLVGFTPATLPDSLPAGVAGPIQDAADSSAAFAGTLLNGTVAGDSGPTTSDQDGSDETATSTLTGDSGSSGQIDRGELERLVHQEVNERRDAHGLNELAFDDDLREVARYHSRDMAEADYFAHTAPDGETLGDRYQRFEYECRVPMGDGRYATGGENIFMTAYSGYTYSEAAIANRIVEGWMESPGHRENLLRDYWRAEGIGVSVTERDGRTVVYVTQNFC